MLFLETKPEVQTSRYKPYHDSVRANKPHSGADSSIAKKTPFLLNAIR